MPLTQQQIDAFNVMNAEVNAIPYNEIQGTEEPPDWWGDHPEPGKSWVCRDYVLRKGRILRNEQGWPALSLRVIFCSTEPFGNPQAREYHAVASLTVDGDIWIFDSRADNIYLFENPPPNLYIWDRIQIAGTDQFEPITA